MSFQVVGLIGCDFSGSTLLSSVLDSIPGVASVGETHWIVDGDQGCRECGDADCPVFTQSALGKLRALDEEQRKASWWPMLADATAAGVVISSDKKPRHYKKLGWPDKYIFLYKDPVAHVYSKARRLARAASRDKISDQDVQESLAWLVSHTSSHLNFLENRADPIAIISNEKFVMNPVSTLEAICDFLGVQSREDALEYWKYSHHYIGGNFSVRRIASSAAGDPSLRIDESYREAMTLAQQDMVRESPEIVQTFDRLHELSSVKNWALFE